MLYYAKKTIQDIHTIFPQNILKISKLGYASDNNHPSVFGEPVDTNSSMSTGTKWLIGGAIAATIAGGVFALTNNSSDESEPKPSESTNKNKSITSLEFIYTIGGAKHYRLYKVSLEVVN